MILIPADASTTVTRDKLLWQTAVPALVAESDPWASASRRLVDNLNDDKGYQFPTHSQVIVTVSPSSYDRLWRAKAEASGLEIVGRGEHLMRPWLTGNTI